jgi:uncharacterized damage-inducible protein DinB
MGRARAARRRRGRPLTDPGFPRGSADERELLLSWLGYLRGAVRRKASGVDDDQARWTPDGRLICLLGVVTHLTAVEQRWIDGGLRGESVRRSEAEFSAANPTPVGDALARYRERGARTDEVVRGLPLNAPCSLEPGTDLRWVLLHLINETARHAGHADAVRELLDGTVGE